MSPTEIIAQYGSLDDLLFRGKNKNYGAYSLRKEYDKRLQQAFMLFFSTLFLFTVPFAIKQFFAEAETINEPIPTVCHFDTKFTRVIEDKIKEWTTAKQVDVQSIKDVAPQIVENLPEQELKTRQDIINATDAISNKDNTGEVGVKPSLEPVLAGEPQAGLPLKETHTEELFELYEIQKEPEFPTDLNSYIIQRYKIPELAYELGLEKAMVVVGFVINEDGSVANVHIESSNNELFNDQALKVIKNMPKWTPGEYNGHKVKVNIAIPLAIELK